MNPPRGLKPALQGEPADTILAEAPMERISRRDLAKGALAATALSYSRIYGANERVGVGYIGVGNRGDQVHDAFLEHGDQQTVALCDLREDYLDFAAKKSRATPTR